MRAAAGMRQALALTSSVLFLLGAHTTYASPISDYLAFGNGTTQFQERGCTPCGYYSTACCAWGEVCYTDSNNEAACSASASSAAPATTSAPACDNCGNSGSWVYWTSTFTSTDLVTYYSTYSSWVGSTPTSIWVAPQTTAPAVSCDYSTGQTSCGPICCADWQYCQVSGQCAPKASGAVTTTWQQQSTWYPDTTYNSYTAPLRPTSLATSTVIPTTTVGFEPAVATGANVTIASESSSSGLSGGAIAGIVIGVIAGIIILILLCLCLCAGALFNRILAFFGFGNKKERRRTEEVEYYHRHGSRADGRTWYGGGNRPPPKKNQSGGLLGFGTIAAGLAAFAAALSFGRRKRKNDEKSDYTSSYGTYSSYSSSSGRRTRDSRRSRR